MAAITSTSLHIFLESPSIVDTASLNTPINFKMNVDSCEDRKGGKKRDTYEVKTF
jgi:hypothetical protein